MTFAKLLQLLRWENSRLSALFRAQLRQELEDLVTRYMRPINGEGPP